jgi:hypothetical protein
MKKVIVIPYFGTLPNYFQLWLDSCGRNPEFAWLLLTDCMLDIYNLPINVTAKNSTLFEVKNIFQANFKKKISLEKPYKLCDLRPLYWMILDYYKIDYDFWGHCDMDLLFGKLSYFLPDTLFEKYDKLGSQGHLSLMSNSPFSKYSFLFDGHKIKWDKVFFTNENYGFDELGMIDIWNKQKFPFYKNRNEILDIDPQFKAFRLANVQLNQKRQYFFLENGKTMQGFWNKQGQFFTKEFAYIHFQKRPMKINSDISKTPFILINQDGFTGINTLPKNYSDYTELIKNIDTKNADYYNKIIRTNVRFYKDKFKRWLKQTTY